MYPRIERGMIKETDHRDMFSYTKTVDAETGLTLVQLRYENPADPRRNLQIAVAPQYGSNLVQFKVGDKDILYTDKQALKEGRWTGCFVLWPLPNRYD